MRTLPRPVSRRAFLSACTRASLAASVLPAISHRALGLATTPAAGPNIAQDPLRPQYHLLPPHNWMNDPNGPIWWKGKFHLFYQMNPHAAVWGDMHWGHAVSPDMVHWSHQPIALAPTPGGPDSDGCFSGSAVVYHGVPTVLYTGIRQAPPAQSTIREGKPTYRETQLLATALDDNLLHWRKQAAPVIAAPPPGMNVSGFRDPCPWQENDGWYLAVGSGQRGVGGAVLLYHSPDLRHWEYLHPLVEGRASGHAGPNPVATGEMWECPDFFPLGKHHCLLYSTSGAVFWTIGDYDRNTHRYTPRQQGVLDHGAYYAPKSFLAPDGRRILWGWIQETRTQAEYAAAGWAGAMSLPRVLDVDAHGNLTMTVAAEVELLRQVQIQQSLNPSTQSIRFSSLHQEFELRLAPQTSAATVRLLAAGKPAWELHLDNAAHTARSGGRSMPLPALAADAPALRLFLDASVIEAFLGSAQALTSRCYTLQPGNTELEITLDAGGSGSITQCELTAISPDRLTT